MLCAIGVHAQKLKINTVPEGLQKAYLDGKDTVPIVNLREIYIYPQVKFKNKREQFSPVEPAIVIPSTITVLSDS